MIVFFISFFVFGMASAIFAYYGLTIDLTGNKPLFAQTASAVMVVMSAACFWFSYDAAKAYIQARREDNS